MMSRVGRIAEFRAELLHLAAELSPVAGPERGQGAVVMYAGAGKVLDRWRRPPGAVAVAACAAVEEMVGGGIAIGAVKSAFSVVLRSSPITMRSL